MTIHVSALDNQVSADIRAAVENPLIDGFLKVSGGLLTVLNSERQVLALNHKFLETFGITKANEVLGLRIGEAIHCSEAKQQTCGTSAACATCGINGTIIAGLVTKQSVGKWCALEIESGNSKRDLYLEVSCNTVQLGDARLYLVFMRDMTRQQQSAASERVFFHDMNNLLTGLVGVSELLTGAENAEARELTSMMQRSIRQLAQDVKIQQCLNDGTLDRYHGYPRKLSAEEVFHDLKQVFACHLLAKGRTVQIEPPEFNVLFETDPSLLSRILCNMMVNALEATPPKGHIKISVAREKESLLFRVWNQAFIPPSVAKRIFQRNFSTKENLGRGLGTYSMKQLGEVALGGKVGFTTSRTEGTTFYFQLPIKSGAVM